jgi:hypothetical protein
MSHSNPPRRNRHRRNPARCESTGLIRYRDRKDAKQAVRNASMMRARAGLDGAVCSWTIVAAFHCAGCRGYHTTSKPRRLTTESAS